VNGDPVMVRIYRSALHLYPRTFRDAYGADMVRLVRDQCTDDSAWAVALRLVVDLAITIPTQHVEAHMNRPSTHLVPLLYTALAAGGLLFAILGGTDTTIVVIGLCIAVIAGTLAVITWRRSGPIGARISTDAWWKLVLVGPCIVMALLVGARFGVEAWEVMMFALLVAFVTTGTGVLLGVARVAQRHARTIPT
jgi:hypothetical protein